MPYPVLPPTPPPVVDVVPAEGDSVRASYPAIAPDSPLPTASAVASVSSQPTVVAPEIIQDYREAPTLDSIEVPVHQSAALGLPIERSASVQQAVDQATASGSSYVSVGAAPSRVLEESASASSTPTQPDSTDLIQTPSLRFRSALESLDESDHTLQNSGIPELESVDPQAFDPSLLDLAPAPGIATLATTSQDAEARSDADQPRVEQAKADLLQPFGDATERSLTALVPLLEALEAHVIELQTASEAIAVENHVGQLQDTDPSLPSQNLPSPFPTQPLPSVTPTSPSESLPLDDAEVPADPVDPPVPPLEDADEPAGSFQLDQDGVPERPTLEIPTPDFPTEDLDSRPVEDSLEDSIDELPSEAEGDDADSGELPEAPASPTGVGDTVEVLADYQEFDQFRQVFIAEGNVEVRFQDSIVRADRVTVNLINRNALAEGNAAILANQQLLFGDRVQYDFARQEGTIDQARGEIALAPLPPSQAPTLPRVNTTLSTDLLRLQLPEDQPPGDVLLERQPPQATPSGETLDFGVGIGDATFELPTDELRRLRFEADTLEFFPGGWEATNVRLTNDPFSPPELELRTSSARLTRTSPTQQVLIAQNPRLVFDRGLSIPLIRERYVFSEEEQDSNPFFVGVGFDEDDRGGLFIERSFQIVDQPDASIQITPQFYIQRAFDSDDFFDPSVFGLEADAELRLSPTTTLFAEAELTSFEFSEFEENFRSNTRLAQKIGDHTLSLFHSYRERIFNGSLGNQTVRNSYGAVLTSPNYFLGDTGIRFSYQAGIQRITANINRDSREDILGPPPRDNNRGTLTRYQVGAQLARSFLLWQGDPLPATPSEGLRYTPTPVVPFLSFDARILGVASFYSSGDTQPLLTTTVGLSGQFGHFSRPAFDYLGFNISYSYTPDGPQSPFNFDREDDRQVIAGGLTAQLFGPVRAGFQTSYNIEKEETINTTFFLQYTRRTYNIDIRFSPIRETGSINFSINGFNWVGPTTPFDESDYD